MTQPLWTGPEEPHLPRLGLMGWVRVLLRGIPIALLVFGGLLVLLLVRLIEWPLYGRARPFTPYITVFACRNALRLLGLSYCCIGTPMQGQGAMVANHSAWLDIFVLNAAKPIYFVAKSEVSGWAFIGWLARATGTVFIERDRKQARLHAQLLEDRLKMGHRLLFFPEGTSTDGRQVLAFKTTLFAPFFAPDLHDTTRIQPVSVIYHAPRGERADFYGWWGDMDFAPSLLLALSTPRHGAVEVIYHDPLDVTAYQDRKALAGAAETLVRKGHTSRLQ